MPKSHWYSWTFDAVKFDYNVGQDDEAIYVSRVWGVEDVDRSGNNRWKSEDIGKIVYDDEFNMALPANQQWLKDICQELWDSELVQDQTVTCWIDDFETYITGVGGTFPTTEADFITAVQSFVANDDKGEEYLDDNFIGAVNGEFKFTVIDATSIGIPHKPYKIMNPLYEWWEEFKDNLNANSGTGLNKAFQTA